MRVSKMYILLSFIVLLVASGCASVYIPNARHTNLLDKKGELGVSVHNGTNGIDVQGAYAVSDHIGIVAGTSLGSQGDEIDSGDEPDPDFHKHKYGELGVTYFRPLGKVGRFELLSGYGLGSSETVNQYNFIESKSIQQVSATGTYNKFFAQSNIGLETKILETGLALRLSQVTFTKFETSSWTHDDSEAGTFFEPAAFARLGWKNVKLEAQAGASYLLQDEADLAFDYRFIFMSMGIRFNLNTLGQ